MYTDVKRLIALAAIFGTISVAQAQTTFDPRGATHFDGIQSYAVRSTMQDGSPASTHGLYCNYWYAASTQQALGTIFQVLPFPYSDASVEVAHVLYQGKMVLDVTFSSQTTRAMIKRELEALPDDSKPHSVQFVADTNLGYMDARLDGKLMNEDFAASVFDGPFNFPWNGSRWTVGAALTGAALTPGYFYAGDLGRLYCIAGDTVYDAVVNPVHHSASGEVRSGTFGTITIAIGKTIIQHSGPLPLSSPTDPDCTIPYHPVLVGKPTVCMQGGMPDFLVNINNNPFSSVGNLTTAPAGSDPWGVWPSTYP